MRIRHLLVLAMVIFWGLAVFGCSGEKVRIAVGMPGGTVPFDAVKVSADTFVEAGDAIDEPCILVGGEIYDDLREKIDETVE